VSQNSVSFPIEDFTRSANLAMDSITGIIIGADGMWQWDDTNFSNLPIGKTNVVSNQTDYSYDADYIVITSMEIQDANGKWIKLQPINESEYNQPLSEVFNVTGTPQYYDKKGSSVFLYPTPNYNATNGLKANFQRKGDYFAINDTTKEPGIAGHLHRYVSLFASYDYALVKGLKQLDRIKVLLEEMRKNIEDFYSYREKDIKAGLRFTRENNK